MGIRPIKRRVQVRPMEPEEKSTGLLVLADTELPDDLICEVVSVANDVIDIKVGETVLVPRTLNRKDARGIFIGEDEVLAHIEF